MVFGYNNGHTLLYGSIILPIEDKSLLLELSDWSGVNEINKANYITGFPLIKTEYYALVKTWYADEMPRPGCAWSHVLLIHKKNFTDIENIEILINVFRRPSLLDENHHVYNIPVEIDSGKVKSPVSYINEFGNNSNLKRIIQELHCTNNPIFLPTDPNIKNELLFLRLWWLQPVNDRYLFTFCTGALTPRRYLNNVFRLQVVEKQSADYEYFVVGSVNEGGNFDCWLDIIQEELITSRSNYVSFLNSITDDISPSKTNSIALATIFELISNEESIESGTLVFKLFNILVKYFPDKTIARKLKRGLLSQKVLVALDEELFFLQNIVTINNDVFDIDDLQVVNRVLDVYENNKATYFDFLNRIIKENINDVGILILGRSSEILNEGDVVILINDYWSLFITFINIRPSLIEFEETWKLSKTQCLELFNVLLSNENAIELNWRIVINALLEKQVAFKPELLITLRKVASDYLSLVLDWFDSHLNSNLQSQWVISLSSNIGKVIDWIEITKNIKLHTSILISKIIDPNSDEIKKRGGSVWLAMSEVSLSSKSKETIYLHAFLTSIAFNFRDNNSETLLKNSFAIVYNEIANDSLDYNLTSMVLIHTKPLLFWQDWDKCKKLRIALADKFNESDWDHGLIYEIVKDYDLAVEIKKLCKKRS